MERYKRGIAAIISSANDRTSFLPIPTPDLAVYSSAPNGMTGNILEDFSVDFISKGVAPGDVIISESSEGAVVTGVISSSQISLDSSSLLFGVSPYWIYRNSNQTTLPNRGGFIFPLQIPTFSSEAYEFITSGGDYCKFNFSLKQPVIPIRAIGFIASTNKLPFSIVW